MGLAELDGRWGKVNRALCETLGYSEEELLEKTFQEMTHPDDLDADFQHMQRILSGEISSYHTEKRCFCKTGSMLWVLLSVSLVRDREGVPLYFFSQFHDITERKMLEKKLTHLAYHDALTDLPNRVFFRDLFERALSRADRNGRHTAILYLDLNCFKQVNDSLGHRAGDDLLVAVAKRLRGGVRAGDTVARLGGDEFCVLLEDVDGVLEAERAAERVRRSLHKPFTFGGRAISVGISIGVAVRAPKENLRADEMLYKADSAMYRAKGSAEGAGPREGLKLASEPRNR